MNITFINKSNINIIKLILEGVEYFLQPEGLLNVTFTGGDNTFTAELLPVNDIGEIQPDKLEKESFKDKLLRKATNKFLKKIPEMALYSAVTYELQDVTSDTVVELESSVYSSCDGDIADFFDMMPVVYLFAKAESADTKINAIKAKNTNRRRFLKLFRRILLFLNWGMLFLNLFEFIPNYAVLKFYATDFYVTRLLKKLYALSKNEREYLIAKKSGEVENKPQNKWKRHLWAFIKVLIVLFALLGIGLWAMSGEPEAVYN